MKRRVLLVVALSCLLLGFLGGSLFQIPIAGQPTYTAGQLRIEVVGQNGNTTTLDFNKVWPAGIRVAGTNWTRTSKGGRANVDVSAAGLTISADRGEGPDQSFLFENIYRIDVSAMCPVTGADGTPGADPVVGSWSWSAPGWTVIFRADGAVLSSSGREINSGSWKVVGTNPRAYEIRWNSRERSIDTMSLSADGRRLSGRNQSGAPVSATRK